VEQLGRNSLRIARVRHAHQLSLINDKLAAVWRILPSVLRSAIT
jgi:hypothetical protein